MSDKQLDFSCEIMQGANDAGVELHTPFHRGRGGHHSYHKVHQGLLNEVRRNSHLSWRCCESMVRRDPVYPWHPSANSSGRINHAILEIYYKYVYYIVLLG